MSRSVTGPLIAPPQNQRPGGRYIEPAQNRVAIEASRTFAQLEKEVHPASSDPFPSSTNSTNIPPSELTQPMQCMIRLREINANIFASRSLCPQRRSSVP